MEFRIAQITVDSIDPLPLARWWASAMQGEIVAENGGWFVLVQVPGWESRLAFQKVEEPSADKNRIHLDLHTAAPDDAVAALLAAGASRVGDHRMEGFGWTVLADPQGNQFCVSGE